MPGQDLVLTGPGGSSVVFSHADLPPSVTLDSLRDLVSARPDVDGRSVRIEQLPIGPALRFTAGKDPVTAVVVEQRAVAVDARDAGSHRAAHDADAMLRTLVSTP